MLKGKKAVIFDMDGVLVDSEKFWKQAEYEVFTALGVNVTDEWSVYTQSMTTREVPRFWYEKFPWKGKTLDEAEQGVVEEVMRLISSEDCVISGIKAYIEELRSRNLKIGLATNAPEKLIPVVLKVTETAHLFDAVSSVEFELQGKPHPDVYLTTARKLNIHPGECLAIEDSVSGMLSARNAGMTVAAFTNGREGLSFEAAHFVITDFRNSLTS